MMVATTSASAAGLNLLDSNTVFTAKLAEDGTSVTLTATVGIGTTKDGSNNLGPITPSGSVSFSDNLHDNLGSATLPSCLLTRCTVTVTVPTSHIQSGTTKLTASYPGDLLLKKSAATVPFSLDSCSLPREDDSPCTTFSSSGTTTVQVDTYAPSGYIEAELGGSGLPCSLGGGAKVATVNAVGVSYDKEVTYSLLGAAADAYQNLNQDFFGEFDATWFCYAAPHNFTAYTNAGSTVFPHNQNSYNRLGDAAHLTSGPYAGDYVGLLPSCDQLEPSSDGPCIEGYDFYYGNPEFPPDQLFVTVLTPPGDPHFGG